MSDNKKLSDIEKFRKLVNLSDEKINVEVIGRIGNGFVTFLEKSKDAKLKQVTITGLDVKHTFAFQLDVKEENKDVKKYRLSPFLNPSLANITKACEGVIFTVVESELIVYLCELKSKAPEPNEYTKKFKSSECFIFYLEKLAKEFMGFDGKLIIKRLLFDRKKNATKTPTKVYKIEKELVKSEGIEMEIYYIHHLNPYKDEFLNVRHLQ
ncbi:hypothetical protein [Candidatus Albibeggiatoa sp. nov. NOAA]|uniref:hypothetical protein n=1 Tax=Candidatus Albibeggiatoa sp. nov. NOAA TaxID=3162724 RepID=UPI0032F577D5|nr:hypothetical protein [Thiotrichaceae bacterium]